MTRGPDRASRWGCATLLLIVALAAGLIWPTPGVADQVRVRAWAHKGFGRIVFDWPSAVKHRTSVAGDRLTITFDRPLAATFDAVRRRLGSYVGEVALAAGGKEVVARLKRRVKVRSFESAKSVVVDLIDRSPAPNSPSKEKPNTNAAPAKIQVRTGEHLGFGRMVFDWPRRVGYNVAKSGRQVTIRFDQPARIDTAPLNKAFPDRVMGVTARVDRTGLVVGFRVPDDVRLRHFRDAARIVVDVLSGTTDRTAAISNDRGRSGGSKPHLARDRAGRDKSKAPIALVPPHRNGRPDPAAGKHKRKTKGPLRRHAKHFGPRAAVVTVDVERNENDLTITFNWREAAAAAAFVRDGRLWLAFDTPARVLLGPIEVAGKGIAKRVEQYPQNGATLLGFDLPARYEADLARDGMKWSLTLHNRDPHAEKDGGLAVRTETGPDGESRVAVDAKGISQPIAFRDPEVGDALVAVPLGEPSQHIAGERRNVQFSLFSTIQGIVIKRIAESVAVKATDTSVIVSAKGGLAMSAAEDIARHGSVSEEGSPLWNLSAWQMGPPEEYESNRQELIRRIIDDPPQQRNAARIRLAKFYLSHGMAADAVGVVETVLRQRPTAQQILTLRSLRGAANLLLRHYVEASEDLGFRQLKDEPGVAPWRAMIAAERGDWRAANDGFTGTEQAIARLPRWLATRFSMTALEAALAVDDLGRAGRLLETLQLEHLPPDRLEYLDLLRGYLLKKQKKPRKALEIWDALVESRNRLVRAKASFARIETLRELGEIKPAEAVKRLSKLSFAWRGDAYEFDLLRRLGELHIELKQYRAGLIRLRQAASYFENVEGAEAVTKLMGDYFKKLYLEGAADDLPPVRALALYDEFRELTPPGPEGEKMIQRLADRLVKVDLLDRAADLLSHQIEFRLSGEDKARVAARLAEIRLLDRKPKRALEALAQSVIADLPEDLSNRRNRIKARALGELGRVDDAMAALGDDYGGVSDEIRLGILWGGESWREVADVVQRSMIGHRITPDDMAGARKILQWAVALAMLDDSTGLTALRHRYLDEMAKTPFAAAFKAIVGGDSGQAPDFETLAKQIGDLDNLKRFLAEFRGKDSAEADAAATATN